MSRVAAKERKERKKRQGVFNREIIEPSTVAKASAVVKTMADEMADKKERKKRGENGRKSVSTTQIRPR